jgi:anti-sigma regulatory factor (Ser/Thr protein kinase)
VRFDKKKDRMTLYCKVFFASLDSMETIISWVKQRLADQYKESKEIIKLELALEEIVVNIYEHGYKKHPGPIFVMVGLAGWDVQISDQTPPFDPLDFEVKEPLTGDLAQMRIGGHGLKMVKTVFKKIEYSFDHGMNQLRWRL